MKNLTDFTADAQTALFKTLGVFFAFSEDQLKANTVKGVEYCNMGGGMIAPTANAQAVAKGLSKIHTQGREQDLAHNGKDGIIRRELFNFETFYTGDITDCVESVIAYGITRDEVLAAYNNIRTTEDVY